MSIAIHPESHLDHGISPEVIRYVLELHADRDAFFVATVTLPEHLPSVPCTLHHDVHEAEVHYAHRGDRAWPSRLCDRAPRMVREVTLVAGPHDGGMVLYTMYGGSAAPREPGDPTLSDEARAASEAFWSTAALCSGT